MKGVGTFPDTWSIFFIHDYILVYGEIKGKTGSSCMVVDPSVQSG